MVRWWLSILIWGVWCVAAAAQDLTALARVLPAETTLEERRGRVVLELGLSQAVPYRVYTLADPHQLVVELSEVAWQGLDPRTLTVKSAPRLQVGTLAPGWSGLVLDLARPLALQAAQIADLEDGVQVALTLAPVNEDRFRETAGAPATAAAILRNPVPRTAPRDKTVVVIDPGHGGVDPGAEREGVQEATLMLLMARELRDALRRTDAFEVHMTRNEDVFVGLPARAALARQIGADAFVSLHADALAGGGAEGATAYSLAETARSA
ncbi:MAG: N-acetylmuramoyl-L-alanine amidase, partial [Pseudomonadota bacterium]